MGGIFLCCRESEFSYAARLGRELELTAGLGPVWIIDRGLDPLSLRALAQEPLDAVLVVIGPEWLTGHAEKRHWIHEPEDAVRRVMANALQTVVLVIPVLVGGGEMPVDDELPPELKGLARCHALRLTDEGWSRGVDELVARLKFQRESLADRRTRSAPSWARSERPEAFRRETRTPGTGPLSSRVPSELPPIRSRRLSWLRHQLRRRGPADEPRDLLDLRTTGHVAVTVDRTLPPEGELVECSVFAPPEVPVGGQALVQVYVHLLEQTQGVVALAHLADVDTGQRAVRSLANPITRGTVLHFDLSMPPLHVDEPVDSLVWRGRPQAVQFRVVIPANFEPGAVVGRIGVAQGTVPIGHIRFRLTVVSRGQRTTKTPTLVGDEAVRYRKAFASYSSQDRAEVVKRLQSLRAVGVALFQDIDMEPGERWARRLYAQIDASDVFLLFWSSAARDSEWVRRETRYALERHGSSDDARPDIRPVLIEGPPIPKPWEEVSHLHFGDMMLYVLASEG